MKYRIFSRIGYLALICFFVLCTAGSIAAQYKGSPVKKDKLIGVLQSRQLQTREIVAVIRSNGVDFKTTPEIEQELVAAGARPEVIVAAKANFRSSGAVEPPKGPAEKTRFTGQPLTKDAIVTLLQNGVSDTQVKSNISSRGVSFKPSAADKTEIKNAGGSAALITLIAASYADPGQKQPTNPVAGPSTSGSESYNNLIDNAIVMYDVKNDTPGAIAALQRAVTLDPKEARAYQQIGFMLLYGEKNFAEAEKYMRLAIDRGGSAVFRLYHDHDGLFATTCQGSLFIAKDTVRFESDDNKHTFETTDDSIRSIKMASVFTSFYKTKLGSFNFKLKSGENESKNYNFAPLTHNGEESKMVIRLIGK